MRKLFVKYPIVILLLVGWVVLGALYLDQARSYCNTTYSGTVTGKSESGGRSSTYYLQVAFDSVPTQSFTVHPITYSEYSIGDRFSIKEDFHLYGVLYTPVDPKYKIMNNVVYALLLYLLLGATAIALAGCVILGLYILNKKMNQILTKGSL